MTKRAFLTIVLLAAVTAAFACTNLIVTKGASSDGSVLVTYAADSHTRYGTLVHYPAANYPAGTLLPIYEWGKDRYLGEIDQAAHTYNVIGNMNEHQVIIGETTWGGLPEFRDPDAVTDYGSLIYITLQRAASAREAIKIFTSLADRYGYASSGESISIADKNEAWILEIIARKPKIVDGKNINKGAVWVAVRIPDGYISAHANCARITTFPLNDPENCLYAKDVISHARETGLFNGKDKDFSFADTYCPLNFSDMRGCEARVWSFFNRFAEEDMTPYIDYASGANPNHRMPLYVKPKVKLSLTDVANMMRDHFEGTPFDMTKDIGAGGNELPYRWRPMDFEIDGETYTNERAIATQQTGFWFVAQSRSWLPDQIGGIFWFATDDAGTSPLTPVYTCSTSVSDHYRLGNGSMIEYSPTSMFWLTNRIAQFAYLRYNQIGTEVQDSLYSHEAKMVKKVAEADARALEAMNTSSSAVVSYLTEFSVVEADALFEQWDRFDKYLLVKYIDGNTKKQDESGNFVTNGHSKTIPPTPVWPGYTEKFKKAIKEDTGDRLKVIK
ncbi:MAG: C69 family dipeptidase [Bacteroidales bacterium]|nr:C69 family dipeptidase [Bacteroidales bacterium]MDD3201676.1 C69 family dipeptidase [Bacteroidales bacterium]